MWQILQLEAICWNKRTNIVHYQQAKIEKIFCFFQAHSTANTSRLAALKEEKIQKGIQSYEMQSKYPFLKMRNVPKAL